MLDRTERVVESWVDRSWTERFGLVGLGVMVFAHLLWDPAVTAVGISQFGITEEDNAVVRILWQLHPLVWVATKVVAVGGLTAVVLRVGAHRDLATAWLPYPVALLGLVAPLGWLELLFLS